LGWRKTWARIHIAEVEGERRGKEEEKLIVEASKPVRDAGAALVDAGVTLVIAIAAYRVAGE
jgi:hypothetical protein